MKIVLRMSIIALALLFPVLSSAGTVVVLERVAWSDEYIKEWGVDEGTRCNQRGHTCKVTVYENMINHNNTWFDVAPMGGYILHAQITTLKVESSSGQYATIPAAGYVFQSDEFNLKITSCTQYPALNGVSVNLGGVAVGTNGWFSVYIP